MSDIVDWTVEEIRAAVDAYLETIGETINPDGPVKIAGLYTEVGAGSIFGGEGVVYVGLDLETNEKIIAYYAGATISASAPIPGTAGGGVFTYTGDAESLGGISAGIQLSAGVTAGVSANIDGDVMAFFGASTTPGATAGAGWTFRVEVDGEYIYNFGTVKRLPTFEDIQGVLSYYEAFQDSANPYYNPDATVEFITELDDGTRVVQEITAVNPGQYSNLSHHDYLIRTYVEDADGNRLRSDEAVAILEDYGFVTRAINYLFDGRPRYDVATAMVKRDGDLGAVLAPEPVECFLAGTSITMSDGAIKNIEDIEIGDKVLSYDADGELVAQRVTKLFRNRVNCILDVHGLMVTPGHVTYCCDGHYSGRHVPIIDILMSDGAIMRQDGTKVRLATNEAVGSELDAFVRIAAAIDLSELRSGRFVETKCRLGTKINTQDGELTNILEMLQQNGFQYDPESELVFTADGKLTPMMFAGPVPRPEDYILTKSNLSLEKIFNLGEWRDEPRLRSGVFVSQSPRFIQ